MRPCNWKGPGLDWEIRREWKRRHRAMHVLISGANAGTGGVSPIKVVATHGGRRQCCFLDVQALGASRRLNGTNRPVISPMGLCHPRSHFEQQTLTMRLLSSRFHNPGDPVGLCADSAVSTPPPIGHGKVHGTAADARPPRPPAKGVARFLSERQDPSRGRTRRLPGDVPPSVDTSVADILELLTEDQRRAVQIARGADVVPDRLSPAQRQAIAIADELDRSNCGLTDDEAMAIAKERSLLDQAEESAPTGSTDSAMGKGNGTPFPYHERQRGGHCLRHAVNNMHQESVLTEQMNTEDAELVDLAREEVRFLDLEVYRFDAPLARLAEALAHKRFGMVVYRGSTDMEYDATRPAAEQQIPSKHYVALKWHRNPQTGMDEIWEIDSQKNQPTLIPDLMAYLGEYDGGLLCAIKPDPEDPLHRLALAG